MNGAIIHRVHLLLEQKRFIEAEKELSFLLQSEPDNAEVLSLCAICYASNNKLVEANNFIKQAISIEPDNPDFQYVYASILINQNKFQEAEKAIKIAIEINPLNANYFSTQAFINLQFKNWSKALDFANEGLAIEPDNIHCLNHRATALIKLGQKENAYETIKEALYQDPENEYTHTNVGWGLLEKGEHKQALFHFRQALQINPELPAAKAGLVEALKARYFLYKLFLKYIFWISNFKGKIQWVIILGFYFGSRVLRSLSSSYPALSPLIDPIIVLYLVFSLSTWVAAPLSNLFLRLNVYGRYALSKDEIMSSNFVGLALLVGLTGTIAYFLGIELAMYISFFGFTMMIPLSSMLNPTDQKRRLALIVYTSSLAGIGILFLMLTLLGMKTELLSTIYLVGIVAYGFVANALITRS